MAVELNTPETELQDVKPCEYCRAAVPEDCICEPELSFSEFRIDTDEKAEWLLGKLSDLEAAEKRIGENAARMLMTINNRRQALMRRFGPDMLELCEAKRQQPGFKGKTVAFLNGKCNWRTSKGGLRVVDTNAALEYVQEHDDLVDQCVTISYRLRTTDYLKVVEAYGEMLPGVDVAPESEAFYVNGTRVSAGSDEPAE